MSAEYTPTTEEIREYIEVGPPQPWEQVTAESKAFDAKRLAAFDRWLAAHDVEVARQASRPITDAQVEAAAEVLLADYQMEYDGGELNEFIDLARAALEAARGVQS